MSAEIPSPPNVPPAELTLAEKIGTYAKAVAAAVVAALTGYITAAEDANVTTVEWIAVVLTFLVALGIVWAIPLTPKWLATYGKFLFGGLVAAGSALVTGLLDDGALSTNEIVTAVIGFLVGSGLTGLVPNAASSDPVDPTTGHLVAIPATVKAAMVDGTSTEVVQSGDIITFVPPYLPPGNTSTGTTTTTVIAPPPVFPPVDGDATEPQEGPSGRLPG